MRLTFSLTASLIILSPFVGCSKGPDNRLRPGPPVGPGSKETFVDKTQRFTLVLDKSTSEFVLSGPPTAQVGKTDNISGRFSDYGGSLTLETNGGDFPAGGTRITLKTSDDGQTLSGDGLVLHQRKD
jgi:hypothetical protein